MGLMRRIRGLGSALAGVLSAEISALVADLAASGRGLLRSLLLFALGFAFAFWTLGLLIYFLVELLALKLARWGAVGIVFALFLAIAVALILASRSRLRSIESPARTVDRRIKGHLAWWQTTVAAQTPARRGGDDFEENYDDEDEVP
jgi:cytochrome c biogenesis protein CcdA